MRRLIFVLSIILVATICVFSFNLLILAQEDPSKNISKAEDEEEDGEKISLDLKGVDIIEIFRTLSLKSGLTIIPSKEVKGRVSIFLNNLTAERALNLILISQGLAYERKGDVITVMTGDEYKVLFGRDFNQKQETKSFKLTYAKPGNVFNVLNQLKSSIGKVIVDESSGTVIIIDTPQELALMEEAIKELDQPLHTLSIDLNYAESTELKDILSDLITPNAGKIITDERNNKIVVYDFPERINKIEKLIAVLDEESRQVSIEVKVVEITLDDETKNGIDWEKIFRKQHNLNVTGEFSASLTSYGRISMGALSNDDYTATMDIIQSLENSRIISSPHIVALNNKEASIMVGTREAYVTDTLSQAEASTVTSESVEFIDVGVKLKVLPTINKDGFITMKIKPEISTVSSTLETSTGSIIPIIMTSEAETVVKVKDGTTIMLAGLLKEEKVSNLETLPILSRVPLLGVLMGRGTSQIRRTEIVIFLTPRLLSGASRYKVVDSKQELGGVKGKIKEAKKEKLANIE